MNQLLTYMTVSHEEHDKDEYCQPNCIRLIHFIIFTSFITPHTTFKTQRIIVIADNFRLLDTIGNVRINLIVGANI